MKSQLLEDIGQSASLSLVPSGRVKQDDAQTRAATPARPRSAFGVWRQKPAGEPVLTVFEPPPPVHEVAIIPADFMLAANAAQIEPAPQGPLFDFTPPSPTTPAPELFKHEPTWFERSGRRYLTWGSCVLSGALVIQAALWFYEGRKEASAPALVANESKAEPKIDQAVNQRPIAAREFTLGPDGDVRVTPAAPVSTPSPLPQTAPSVPRLVLLEPEAAPAAKIKSTPALEAGRVEIQATPKPERVAEQAPSLPKRVRPAARAPVPQAERKSEQDTAMAATLKACREHGYHAAQCVKRGCSVTKYGFVCRGK